MTLILELPPELELRLEEEAARNGQPMQEYAVALLTRQLDRPRADRSEKPGTKRLWEVAAEIMQDVPERELERLPVDLSENLDHYLYGTPKRSA
jgi:hypothetical protein